MHKTAVPLIAASMLLLPTGAAAENIIQLAESKSSIQPFTITAPKLEKHSDAELRSMTSGSVHLAGPRARAILVGRSVHDLNDFKNPETTMDLSKHEVVVERTHQVLVAQVLDPKGQVLMTAEYDPSAAPKNKSTVMAQAE